MPVLPNSRNLLTDVVQPIDPVSGDPSSPAFIDLRQRVTTYASDDQFYTVLNSDTWGFIGLKLLGDARNWWAIADLSGIVDPFAELVVGAQLRAPSITRFTFSIMAPQNTKS